MSNSLRLLETLGQNPAMTMLSATDLERLMDNMSVDNPQRDALRRGDTHLLSTMLGGRQLMIPLLRDTGESRDDFPEEDPQE